MEWLIITDMTDFLVNVPAAGAVGVDGEAS